MFHKSATEQTFFSRSVKVKVNSMVSVGSKYWPIGVMSQVSFSRLDLKSWHLRRDMSKFKILPYEHSPVELLDLTGVLKKLCGFDTSNYSYPHVLMDVKYGTLPIY